MYANQYQEFTSPDTTEAEAEKTEKNFTAKLTAYLRWVGSLLIMISAISFMFQGDADILPTYRYWIGLGLTLLLCGGGLVCAYLFNETKGARIFFGLGTVFLSVQVSQVSAMIYGYWHGDAALQPQYSWLQFMDINPVIIIFDFVLTGIMLWLISYASFSILARKHYKILLGTFAASNLLLMLPIRDAMLIPVIIASLYIYLRHIENRLIADSSMRTAEGLAARALISLPLWMIMGRTLLHPTSWLLAIVVSSIVAMYCIVDIKRYTQSTTLNYISQWFGTFAALGVWLIVVDQFSSVSSSHLNALLPITVILFGLSFQVDFHARLYRNVSALLTLLITYGAMFDQQAYAPIFSISAGSLLTIAGVKCREKLPLFIGNLCVAGGFLFYWEYAVNLYSHAPWISSIGLGLGIILLASYIENKNKQIVEKSRLYFNELKTWD